VDSEKLNQDMNIYIFSGNGEVTINNKIRDLTKSFSKEAISEIDGKYMTFEQILVHLSTPSLFSEQRLVILDQPDEKIDLSLLPKNEEVTLVLRFHKTLPKTSTFLKQAAKLEAKTFQFSEQEEASIFPLIDLLADKNPRALQEVDYRIEEHSGQYILTMIFYMLRRMVQRNHKLPGFVVSKIERQKKNFPLEKIIKLYEEALKTDFKIKSGRIEEKLGLTLLFEKIINF
jgi:DNA polymerase III delta subunit